MGWLALVLLVWHVPAQAGGETPHDPVADSLTAAAQTLAVPAQLAAQNKPAEAVDKLEQLPALINSLERLLQQASVLLHKPPDQGGLGENDQRRPKLIAAVNAVATALTALYNTGFKTVAEAIPEPLAPLRQLNTKLVVPTGQKVTAEQGLLALNTLKEHLAKLRTTLPLGLRIKQAWDKTAPGGQAPVGVHAATQQLVKALGETSLKDNDAVKALTALVGKPDHPAVAAKKALDEQLNEALRGTALGFSTLAGYVDAVIADSQQPTRTLTGEPLPESARINRDTLHLASLQPLLNPITEILRTWHNDVQRALAAAKWDEQSNAKEWVKLDTVNAQAALLEASRKQLALRISELQSSVAAAGNMDSFVTVAVRLYYFGDAGRLVQLLNPAADTLGSPDRFRLRANELRRALTASMVNLATARITVSDAQADLVRVRGQLARAEAELEQTETSKRDVDRALRNVQRQLAAPADETGATDGSDELDAETAEETTQAATQEALKEEQAALEEERDDLEAEQKQLTQEVTDLKAERDRLETDLKTADTALTNAHRTLRTAQQADLVTTYDELAAIAEARANTPIVATNALPSDADPVKRVFLHAFVNSQTIYVRGRPRDVVKVQQLIEQYDRPVPQAMLALWTLKMSARADDAGWEERFNDGLDTVTVLLTDCEDRTRGALELLRACVQDQVARVVSRNRYRYTFAPDAQDQLAGYHFYEPEVAWQLGFLDADGHSPAPTPDGGGGVSAYRMGDGTPDWPAIEVVETVIPDSRRIITLGETLLVLTLARAELRDAAMLNFEARLQPLMEQYDRRLRLAGEHVLTTHALARLDTRRDDGWRDSDWFLRLKQTLSHDPTRLQNTQSGFTPLRPLGWLGGSGNRPLTGDQLMLIEALRTVAARRLLPTLIIATVDWNRTNTRGPGSPDNLPKPTGSIHRITTILEWMERFFRLSADDWHILSRDVKAVVERIETLRDGEQPTPAIQADMRLALEQILKLHVRTSPERIAAAESRLKAMFQAVEDDLNDQFVLPMMRVVRRELQRDRLNVGIIERSEVLASNRRVARVEPMASAQLKVGQEQAVLEASTQLATLVGAFQGATALQMLSALDTLDKQQQRNQPPPAIYGLTNHHLFEVTPIFSPSGQSLRYQFDFVSETLITEPDGQVHPQLPRVERHTVSTEVELTNFELRPISRFHANSQLGRPEERSGGIPLLNQIPGLRDLPIIGYFTRTAGRAPVVQESLILCQTAMYPSLIDLVNLMTASSAVRADDPTLLDPQDLMERAWPTQSASGEGNAVVAAEPERPAGDPDGGDEAEARVGGSPADPPQLDGSPADPGG